MFSIFNDLTIAIIQQDDQRWLSILIHEFLFLLFTGKLGVETDFINRSSNNNSINSNIINNHKWTINNHKFWYDPAAE